MIDRLPRKRGSVIIDIFGRGRVIIEASLQKNGYAKWKVVDFNFPLRGGEQYDCVREYLGKAAPATAPPPRTGQNSVFEAIKGALDQ